MHFLDEFLYVCFLWCWICHNWWSILARVKKRSCWSSVRMPGIQNGWIEAAFTSGDPGDRRGVATGRQPSRVVCFFLFQRAFAEPSSSNLHSRSQPLCRWPCVPEIRPFLRPFNWKSPFYRSLWMAAVWKIGKGSGLGWLQAIVETTHPWRGRHVPCNCRALETLGKSQMMPRPKVASDIGRCTLFIAQPRLYTDAIWLSEAVYIWRSSAQLHYMKHYWAAPLPLTPF